MELRVFWSCYPNVYTISDTVHHARIKGCAEEQSSNDVAGHHKMLTMMLPDEVGRGELIFLASSSNCHHHGPTTCGFYQSATCNSFLKRDALVTGDLKNTYAVLHNTDGTNNRSSNRNLGYTYSTLGGIFPGNIPSRGDQQAG